MGTSNQQDTASPENGDYHIPVLLHKTVAHLAINPEGVYVDCTFGGGGHSRAILATLSPGGKLIAFDQDKDAQRNIPDDPRVLFVPQNFRYLQKFLRLHGISAVDGILADLGVSSFQFDEAERGFSIRYNAALDMRMDQRQSLTAADILQTYNEARLHKLFEQYGEVTNSRTLASTIIEGRRKVPVKTIDDLKNMLSPIVKGNPNKYFAQVFQALRMEVNDEMGALKEMLAQTPQVLKPGGRIAVISFHSIEDRIVKNFFRDGGFETVEENPFENTKTDKVFRVITRKPVTASDTEMKTNPRSRSAKLRVAERI